MEVTVRREPLDGPVAHELIGALNAELTSRYPEENDQHFRLDAAEVAPGQGAFVVAYLGEEPVGCGAVRRVGGGGGEGVGADVGEVKRMFVREHARGRRVAAKVLVALEAEARALGLTRLVLETGVRQPEALALYARAGFARIAAFGEYVDSPLSVCMGKDLAAEG